MGLFGWLKRGNDSESRAQQQWREAWAAALESEDVSRVEALRGELEQRSSTDDVEMELEMLDALEQLARVRAETAGGALPLVETGHRVVGSEVCHFSAPASLPDDPAQPSGRVLFTPTRSLFVGGGKTGAIAWHAVQHIVRSDRDLLLARADGINGSRFRFNTFADAAIAAFLAGRLKAVRAPRVL
jgi:hypothetical protein